MGMYDTVTVICPHCGKLAEYQSKAGDCSLANYSKHLVPLEIANDINGEFLCCESCDNRMMIIIDPKKQPETVQMVVVAMN